MKVHSIVFVISLLIFSTCSMPDPSNTNITFIFDDGNISVYNHAYPVFKELDVKACVALDVSNWMKLQNKMSLSEVHILQNDGWEIMSHSMTHKLLKNMSEEEVRWELVESKRLLSAMGFKISFFVSPNSNFPEDKLYLLTNVYLGSFQNNIHNDMSVNKLLIANNKDLYKLKRLSIETKSFYQIKGSIKEAIIKEKWLVIYIHHVEDPDARYHVSQKRLRRLLKYIKKRNVKILVA